MLETLGQDIFLIGFLAFLEGILSIDNALVLALMARPLPPEQRRKALTYGLIGAVFFRMVALGLATHLMKWHWVKLVGGLYLVVIAVKHLWEQFKKRGSHSEDPEEQSAQASAQKPPRFWFTVARIEMMDIAFAVDSILAAVAITQKFWIVFAGGFMGVILIRFAATIFIRILDRFPAMERTAYLLVLIIGTKLCVHWLELPGVHFDRADNPAFWVFWGLMALCTATGFTSRRRSS
jgi:YkoY family integral membrane protein